MLCANMFNHLTAWFSWCYATSLKVSSQVPVAPFSTCLILCLRPPFPSTFVVNSPFTPCPSFCSLFSPPVNLSPPLSQGEILPEPVRPVPSAPVEKRCQRFMWDGGFLAPRPRASEAAGPREWARIPAPSLLAGGGGVCGVGCLLQHPAAICLTGLEGAAAVCCCCFLSGCSYRSHKLGPEHPQKPIVQHENIKLIKTESFSQAEYTSTAVKENNCRPLNEFSGPEA